MNARIKLATALSSERDLTDYFRENYSTDELADLLLEKRAAIPGAGMLASGINKAAPYLAKGVNAVRNATPRQAMGFGSAGGAVLGAGRHLLSRRDPQTGQKRTTLLGSMAGGAAAGAVGGLGARAAAQNFHGSGLHNRMTSGNFQFASRGAQPQLKGFQDPGPSFAPVGRSPGAGGTAITIGGRAPEPLVRQVHRQGTLYGMPA